MSARAGVCVLLFDGVEWLDFAGPIEVFSVAARYVEPPFGVQTVSEQTEVVTTHNGLRGLPDLPYDDCLDPQVLVIPGAEEPGSSWKTSVCWPGCPQRSRTRN